MDADLRSNLFQQAKDWVMEAGANIKAKIDDPLTINTKSNAKDLVTHMDQETERFFQTKIKKKYPDHFLLSEEGYGDNLSNLDGIVWIIDPIDGTMNFVQQKRNFAISVGIYLDGIGEIGIIYNVMDDVLYHAIRGEGAFKDDVRLPKLKESLTLEESMIGLNHNWLCRNRLVKEDTMQQLVRKVRGTRTYGSAALEFAYVAEGIMDGYLTMGLAPWDVAAGIVIVNEVGGVTTTIDGQSVNMLTTNPIITCNSEIHSQVIVEYIKKGRK
ncbi:inositol monophosphatase family protein [Ornithinibacillus halophilus]|uniref:inositol-phosphate phosphatase n=1 Tax=Ornithinibacillus halophilus TaxID=930117 RepID=A0A1M5C0W2_9BACI|nr:inositol monophosphatase family protein [Ornithinibacillus halophilus]SHF48388.1 myo-inositol-1(or 4)-monophosphatase [Ornithinibacillus halophilus]